jgi:hypothetical protein
MLRPNPKHEAFAQAIADGAPILEAMKRAHMKPDRGNGCRLLARVKQRVQELKAERSPPAPSFVMPRGLSVESSAIWESLVQQYVIASRNADSKLMHRITNSLRFMVKKEKYNSEQPAEPAPVHNPRPWLADMPISELAKKLSVALAELPDGPLDQARQNERTRLLLEGLR